MDLGQCFRRRDIQLEGHRGCSALPQLGSARDEPDGSVYRTMAMVYKFQYIPLGGDVHDLSGWMLLRRVVSFLARDIPKPVDSNIVLHRPCHLAW